MYHSNRNPDRGADQRAGGAQHTRNSPDANRSGRGQSVIGSGNTATQASRPCIHDAADPLKLSRPLKRSPGKALTRTDDLRRAELARFSRLTGWLQTAEATHSTLSSVPVPPRSPRQPYSLLVLRRDRPALVIVTESRFGDAAYRAWLAGLVRSGAQVLALSGDSPGKAVERVAGALRLPPSAGRTSLANGRKAASGAHQVAEALFNG